MCLSAVHTSSRCQQPCRRCHSATLRLSNRCAAQQGVLQKRGPWLLRFDQWPWHPRNRRQRPWQPSCQQRCLCPRVSRMKCIGSFALLHSFELSQSSLHFFSLMHSMNFLNSHRILGDISVHYLQTSVLGFSVLFQKRHCPFWKISLAFWYSSVFFQKFLLNV